MTLNSSKIDSGLHQNHRSRISTVLLTGPTGFLGSHMIDPLLKVGTPKIFLLSRSSPNGSAAERALDAFNFTRSESERITSFQDLSPAEIKVLDGDISLPDLGLETRTIDKVRSEIGAVLNTAGIVSFEVNPDNKRQLQAVNIDGTNNLLDICEESGAELYHTGTAYLEVDKTPSRQEISEEILYPPDLKQCNHPYEWSKRAGDQAIYQHRNQVSSLIFRPTIIIGQTPEGKNPGYISSITGTYGFFKALWVLRDRFKGDLHLPGNPNAYINMIPVDWMAQKMVAIMQQGIQENSLGVDIVNLAAESPLTYEQVIAAFGSILNKNITINPDFNKDQASQIERIIYEQIKRYLAYVTAELHFSIDELKKRNLNDQGQEITLDSFKKMMKKIAKENFKIPNI